jgi:hypothetical protein
MKSETRDDALHCLEALLRGVWMDGQVCEAEISLLLEWTHTHREFETESPFDVLIPELEKVLDDGHFDNGELDDLFWLIEGYKMSSDTIHGSVPDSMKLRGMLRAVVADGKVSTAELKGLHDWLLFVNSEGLAGEYSEIMELVNKAMRQSEVSEDTLSHLLHVFRGFLADTDGPTI